LAALVMEMAEAGRSTQGLAPQASEAEVQTALGWSEALWPWQNYGPVAMAAVRAGVPVLGGNLPRSQLRTAQTDTSLEALLGPAALERQRQAVRDGHCGLLPESRVPGMARIQVARDQSMAQTASAARRTGQVVLLVAGAAHVKRSLGVPAHLPQSLNIKVAIAHAGKADSAIKSEADWWHATPALPPDDACDKLRQRWQGKPAR
ncbi:MAG TPA: ChaN family lipoprotein, partial [Giesbergeria sp.]|nr:ChaN family lipoprotein [Giesbergeria sp.]